ncbi:MAG: hypothetical protein ACRDF0_08710 [Candidatus Limnocylindria bacterium]
MSGYAVMWSGGKDSALALARAREAGAEIGCLLNFIDAASRRVRFHATRAELIAEQAAAAGLPLRQHATSWPEFESAFRRALAELKDDGFAGVVFGDIHLADVRAWYEERVRAAGLEHVEPIWGGEPRGLLAEFVRSGGRAVVTCCELAKLDGRWLGRIVDERFAAEIDLAGIDVCGENGEYHSFAFAGPAFQRPVAWLAGAPHREAGFLQLDLLEPQLELAAAVATTIASHPDLVEGTVSGRPKAWGALAAKGLVVLRGRLGRALEERERRALWDALWQGAQRAAATAPTAGDGGSAPGASR